MAVVSSLWIIFSEQLGIRLRSDIRIRNEIQIKARGVTSANLLRDAFDQLVKSSAGASIVVTPIGS